MIRDNLVPLELVPAARLTTAAFIVGLALKVLLPALGIAFGAPIVPLIAVVIGVAFAVIAVWAGPEPATRQTIAAAALTGFLAACVAVGFVSGAATAAAAL